jgi:hypothetical protein
VSGRIEFEISGTPKATNALLGRHKQVVAKNADEWKGLVAWMLRKVGRPARPFMRARITLHRFGNRMLDYDGLTASFKPVVDGLVEQKVLWNDTWSVTGKWDVDQFPCPKGQDRIRVVVEEIEVPEEVRARMEIERAKQAERDRVRSEKRRRRWRGSGR